METKYKILDTSNPLEFLEHVGRVSYNSESKGDPITFLEKLIKLGHYSVFEHLWILERHPTGVKVNDSSIQFIHPFKWQVCIDDCVYTYSNAREHIEAGKSLEEIVKLYQTGLSYELNSSWFKFASVEVECSRVCAQQLTRHRFPFTYMMESQRHIVDLAAKRHGWCKLTYGDDKEICDLYKIGHNIAEIAKKFKVDDKTIKSVLLTYNTVARGPYDKQCKNPNLFDSNCLTPISAQLLGLIFSDGCLTHHGKSNVITFEMKDRHFVEQLKYSLGTRSFYASPTKNTFCTKVSSRSMYEDLINTYKCSEAKSLTLTFEGIFRNVPHELIPHFVRGFFEGDGSFGVYNNRPQLSFYSGSEKCLEQLSNFLTDEVGVKYRHVYKGGCYVLKYYRSADISKLIKWMYKNIDLSLCLYRKLILVNDFINLNCEIDDAFTRFGREHNQVIPNSFRSSLYAICNYCESIQKSLWAYKDSLVVLDKEDSRYLLPLGTKTRLIVTSPLVGFSHLFSQRAVIRPGNKPQGEIHELTKAIMSDLQNIYGTDLVKPQKLSFGGVS